MGAHGVVVALVFPDQMLQMVFPEHDEMVEAFLLYTLNEPFDWIVAPQTRTLRVCTIRDDKG